MNKDSIKQAYENGFCVINEREYEFDKMKWKDAKRVFSFFLKNANSIEKGQIDFIDREDFEKIEVLMFGYMSFDGHLLSKIQDSHFDEYAEDYLELIMYGLSVFSFPFMKGSISA